MTINAKITVIPRKGVTVNSPDDVKTLPWKGNWGEDADLYEAVNEYIKREPDLKKRQQADALASECGMGVTFPNYPADYDPLTDID